MIFSKKLQLIMLSLLVLVATSYLVSADACSNFNSSLGFCYDFSANGGQMDTNIWNVTNTSGTVQINSSGLWISNSGDKVFTNQNILSPTSYNYTIKSNGASWQDSKSNYMISHGVYGAAGWGAIIFVNTGRIDISADNDNGGTDEATAAGGNFVVGQYYNMTLKYGIGTQRQVNATKDGVQFGVGTAQTKNTLWNQVIGFREDVNGAMNIRWVMAYNGSIEPLGGTGGGGGGSGDNSGLNITILQPLNNSYDSASEPTFKINLQSDSGGLNCLWFINEVLILNDTNLPVGYWLRTFGAFPEGKNNWSLHCNNVMNVKNTNISFFYIDQTPPTISLMPNNAFDNFNQSRINQYSNLFHFDINFSDNVFLNNITINIHNSSNDLVYSYFNASIPHDSFNFIQDVDISSWDRGFYLINITAEDWMFNANQTNSWYHEKLSYGFNSPVVAGLNQLIQVNLSKSVGFVNDTNGVLYFNGVQHNFTQTNYSDLTVLNSIFSPPASSIPYTANVMINISVLQANGSKYYFNFSFLQSVLPFGIAPYNTTSPMSANFSVWNENDPPYPLNATFEVAGITWTGSKDNNIAFNFTVNNSHSFGISTLYSPSYADVYIKYSVPGGFVTRYFLVNTTLTNVSQDISLYDYNYTTGVSLLTITVRNKQSFQYYPNVYGKLLRKYVGEGVYRTVQMDKTGDYGLLTYYIQERDIDYQFIFLDENGNLLQQSNDMKFVCTAYRCDLTYVLNPIAAQQSEDGLSISMNYNNDTKMIDIVWNDYKGYTTNVNFLVTKDQPDGKLTICNINAVGASGTQTCDVSSYSGLVYVSSNALQNGVLKYEQSQFIDLPIGSFANHIGQREGSFWTAALIMVVSMATIFSPIAGVIGMCFALFIAYILHLTTVLSMTLLILVFVISLVIAFKIRS